MALTETATLPDLGAVCVLRPARLADVYAAIELVSVPADVAGDARARTAYQLAVDDAQVLLQVQDRDGQPVADLPALRDELSPDDMQALREAADRLKKKRRSSNAPALSPEFDS